MKRDELIKKDKDREDVFEPGSFTGFVFNVRELLELFARTKGYNLTGPDGENELYDFVSRLADGPGHALGEIVYKCQRYASNRDKKDLEKIAAWAFLVWKHDPGGK